MPLRGRPGFNPDPYKDEEVTAVKPKADEKPPTPPYHNPDEDGLPPKPPWLKTLRRTRNVNRSSVWDFSSKYLTTAAWHLAGSKLQDHKASQSLEAVSEYMGWVDMLDSFGGEPGRLSQARLEADSISDPAVRAQANNLLNALQKLPVDQQQAVLTWLETGQNAVLSAQRGNVLTASEVGGEVLDEAFAEGSILKTGEMGLEFANEAASVSKLTALRELFPDINAYLGDDLYEGQGVDDVLQSMTAREIGNTVARNKTAQEIADYLYEDNTGIRGITDVAADIQSGAEDNYLRAFLRTSGSVVNIGAELAMQSAGYLGRANPLTRGLTNTIADKWDAIDMIVFQAGYDPRSGDRAYLERIFAVGLDPNDPNYQRDLEARMGALAFLGFGAAQAGSSIARRIKITRGALTPDIAASELDNLLPNTIGSLREAGVTPGILDYPLNVIRGPARAVAQRVNRQVLRLAREPADFFAEGISGRRGRTLLKVMDAAKKAHPGDIDGQTQYVRDVYGTFINEKLTRSMLKQDTHEGMQRVFVDTLANPSSGTSAIRPLQRRLNKVERQIARWSSQTELDKRAIALDRLNREIASLKADIDADMRIGESGAFLRQKRQRLAELRDQLEGFERDELNVERLKLERTSLQNRIDTTFDDSPMFSFPKRSRVRTFVRQPITEGNRAGRVMRWMFARPGGTFDLAKTVDDLPRHPQLYVHGSPDSPVNALDHNITTLSNIMRRAGVDTRTSQRLLGRLSQTKNRQEWFDLVEREIYGEGGAIDVALSNRRVAVDSDIRQRAIRIHNRNMNERTRSVYEKVETTADGRRVVTQHHVMGRQDTLSGDTTPIPSRPSEDLGRIILPDIDLLIEADSLIRRSARALRNKGGAVAALGLVYDVPRFVLQLATMVQKPLILLSRLPAMGMRIQFEQALRAQQLGYKPFYLPKGISLLPGGIPVPDGRVAQFAYQIFGGWGVEPGTKIGGSLFTQRGWKLLAEDPRFNGLSSDAGPEAMGMMMTELMENPGSTLTPRSTVDVRIGKRAINNRDLEAWRDSLDHARRDFVDRKIAELNGDVDAIIEWLDTDPRARLWYGSEMAPRVAEHYKGKTTDPYTTQLHPPIPGRDRTLLTIDGPGGEHISLQLMDDGNWFVNYVEVPEALRRQGVGTALYQKAAHEVKGRGGKLVSGTQQTPEAESFWRAQAARGNATETGTADGSPGQWEWTASDGWQKVEVDGKREWVRERVAYVESLTKGNDRLRRAIATGNIVRHRTATGTRHLPFTGRHVADTYNGEVEKLAAINAELRARTRQPNADPADPDVVALQEQRRVAIRKIQRMQNNHPEAIASGERSVDLADKRKARNALKDLWDQGDADIPDLLVYPDNIPNHQFDMGVMDDITHGVQSFSNLLYRGFKPLTYVDKKGTRGSMFNQAQHRAFATAKRMGYDDKTARAIAFAKASERTIDMMYDLSARSSVHRALKDLFWFAPAFQEVMYTWFVKIPSESYWPIGMLAVATKGAAILHGLEEIGVIERDANDERIIVVPGLSQVVSKITGHNVPEISFGKASGLNVVTTGGLRPGLSTMPNWLLGEAALRIGGPFKAISDEMQPYGPETNMMPAPIIYAWEAMMGEAPRWELLGGDYVKAQWDRSMDVGLQHAFRDLTKQGIHPPKPEDFGTKQEDGTWELSAEQEAAFIQANSAYFDRLMREGQSYAQGAAFVRLLGSTVSPMSLYTSTEEEQIWRKFWNGLVPPEGFGSEGITDAMDEQINSFLQANPNSFAYSVWTTRMGREDGSLPFGESQDDNFYDEFYTGAKEYWDPEDYSVNLMYHETDRFYSNVYGTSLREISPELDPWELLRNGFKRKDALMEFVEARERYLDLNPDARSILDEQRARWLEEGNAPVRTWEAQRITETISALNQVSGMLTGEEGVRPAALKETIAMLYELNAEDGRYGAPNTPTEKAIADWAENVMVPYLERTGHLYNQAQEATSSGLDASPYYEQIREINNELYEKYGSNGAPSPEEAFFSNRSPQEQASARLTWASRPPNWLSNFQLSELGINASSEDAKFLTALNEIEKTRYDYAEEHSVVFGSDEYDDLMRWRNDNIRSAADYYGGNADRLAELANMMPFQRATELGMIEGEGWGPTVEAAELALREIEQEGVSPRGFSADALPWKRWLYSNIEQWRADNPEYDRMLTEASLSFPLPRGYRDNVVLYEALFFGNFNEDFIPESLAEIGAK